MFSRLLYNSVFEKISNVIYTNYTNFQTKIKLRNVTIGEKSVLSPESRIENLQGKKEKIKIGSNTFIRGELLIFAHGGYLQIGNYCYVGANSRIWTAEEVIIGNHVLISHDVNIHDNNAHPIDLKKREEHFKAILNSGHPTEGLDLKEKKIIIKDNAWIGFNSIILKGVTIGEGAIVGAGSVVTQDIPDYAVVAGNPATIIKYLK